MEGREKEEKRVAVRGKMQYNRAKLERFSFKQGG